MTLASVDAANPLATLRLIPGDGIVVRTGEAVVVSAPINDPSSLAYLVAAVEAADRAADTGSLGAAKGLANAVRAVTTMAAGAVVGDDGVAIFASGGAAAHVDGTDPVAGADGPVWLMTHPSLIRLGISGASALGWSRLDAGAVPAAGCELLLGGAGGPATAAPTTAAPAVAPAPAPSPAPAPLSPAVPSSPAGAGGPGAPAAAAAAGAVEVDGIVCADGHFNHPDAMTCAWCGVGMSNVTRRLVRGPRPPLGSLVLDDQTTYPLDGDYVVGRRPDVADDVRTGRARPIAITDPDRHLSRAHVSVQLHGWEVVAVDAGSANGTWIQAPGQQPTPLAPGRPTPVPAGGTLHLGGHTLTFHSHYLRPAV